MISKIKNLVFAAALLFAVATPVALTAGVSAQNPITDGVTCGTELKVQANGCSTSQTTGVTGLQGILTQAVNIFSIIVGVIAVIMIIVGGLKYITSGGDSSNVSGAKNTIIYAIVGLIIVALAQFIVRFVLGTASKAATGTP